MPVPFGSVTLFAGEVKSAESVRKKFNKIVDLITEARKFDTTLNDILTAVKDMAEGIKAKYEEKITLGEVV
jgi:Asp-tRNA(Asn)/Glu-tRNA(Gln) amidotransferase C subunit